MKYAVLLVLTLLTMPSLPAQDPADPVPLPSQTESADAFALSQPDEGSPFFADRELSAAKNRTDARDELGHATGRYQTALYPRVHDSSNNGGAAFANFFTRMFSSIRFGNPKGGIGPSKLTIEPEEFSITERREVDATYQIRNHGRKILRLDYPTSQRIEILAADGSGRVIERWSDDRAFDDQEGIIFINPKERIQYVEKIPTREMKAGESYTITAEAVGHPELNASRVVTPAP